MPQVVSTEEAGGRGRESGRPAAPPGGETCRESGETREITSRSSQEVAGPTPRTQLFKGEFHGNVVFQNLLVCKREVISQVVSLKYICMIYINVGEMCFILMNVYNESISFYPPFS